MKDESGQKLLIWHPPPPAGRFPLPPGDLHVWRASITHSASGLATLSASLTADEQRRADRYHQREDHLRFVIGRGVLRHLLGRYLGTAPLDIEFKIGPFGKPSVACFGPIEFNVTHSGDLILFAFTPGRPVGIDVECMTAIADLLSVAREVFCPDEGEALSKLAGTARQELFFRLWVRKEALLKATGRGLAGSPRDVNVLATPSAAATGNSLISPTGLPWSISDLAVAPEYAAAIASDGANLNLRTWSAATVHLT